MPEVYTCVCGGQKWTIFGKSIQCNKCFAEFKIGGSYSANEFNEVRESIQSEKGVVADGETN